MFRRILQNVIDNTLQPQTENLFYQNPFTSQETLHLSWLSSIAPCFPVKSSNITILTEPQQFYETLLQYCQTATDRITLASLYFGNGKLEKKLVDSLMNNTNFKEDKLKVNILLDYTRGSRTKDNSRTTLLSLLLKNDQNCNIYLYHTPALRGLLKKYMPDRFNEVLGLQHMKLYIFDDTLVISGGNLSNDYFTNRQDRYFVIKDKSLTDFYCGLVNRVQKFSLAMDKANNVNLHNEWNYSPYSGNKNKFVQNAGDMIENYILEMRDDQNHHKTEGYDTWIFPLVQMGQLGIEHDSQVTKKLLAEAPEYSKLNIASGYFNLTKEYMQTLLTNTKADCKILMAHPKANGFLGAKGITGSIPAAYSLIAQQFHASLEYYGQGDRIKLFEYQREGWTYHAKGLWYYPPKSEYPCLTLIGSPNFGERSVKKDLESQLAIVTDNMELRKDLHKECEKLYKLGLPAEIDRVVPKWVYAFVYFFRGYF